jgi:Prealbumin-like fold domain
MTALRREFKRKRRFVAFYTTLAAMALGLVLALPAMANHPESSLPGSNFEIDNNANLKRDDATPSIDWASVTESRRSDLATGQNDDSYSGGAKEDDACPGTTTGSIPNNKSDLLTFGAYVEPEANGPGFLNLFWHRVQEPSGTTLMDFELNQSSTPCANGVNPVRTAGDLLLEYRIEQGGAVATIKVREWSGSAWGPAVDLTAAAQAAGTINSTSIPAADSDGLATAPNSVSARTFGEAQLDLDFIFDEGDCESFGSAFIKSRASDSFTSQLKDLIKPIPVNITNCGTVIIHKETDPDEDPNSTDFGYTKSFSTDPATLNTFTLKDDGTKTFNNVLFGSGYTVVENVIPAGWDFDDLNCDASVGVTPSITDATVTFAVNNSADVLECTYTNKARGAIVIEKETVTGAGSFDFTSTTLTPASWTLTTTGPGEAGVDSETFSDLAPGTYDAAETVPVNWNLDSATCDDGSSVDAIGVSAGETVTCRFVDSQEAGAIKITKTRKHAATPDNDAHEGVTFTISGGSLQDPVEVVTDANGVACYDGLLDGSYTVTETVPSGYVSDDAEKSVSVTAESSCGDGNEAPVSFHNTPLTDITVSVDSQVDGGTASDIDCGGSNTASTDPDGDGSLTLSDLEPTAPVVTVTCTITVDP